VLTVAQPSTILSEYLLGRLYANVLLATLNGRQRMRLAATSDHEFSMKSTGKNSTNQAQVQLSNLRSYPTPSHQSSKTYPVVSVTTDVQVDDDSMLPKSKVRPSSLYSAHPLELTLVLLLALRQRHVSLTYSLYWLDPLDLSTQWTKSISLYQ
jgi:uncharacterized protein YcfL